MIPDNLLHLAMSTKRDKEIREGIAPGVHEVDGTIRIHGTFTVGDDFDVAPTASLPIKEVLALFIHYCGCTRERAIHALVNAATDAIAENGKAKGALAANIPIVEETLARVQNDVIDMLPRVDRKGVVRQNLVIEHVN